MSPRKTVFKRQSLPSRTTISRHRLAKVCSYKFLSALQYARGIPHPCGICPRSYWVKGILQGLCRTSKIYTKQHGRIKQVKAQLAQLDNFIDIDEEVWTSRKFTKKSNVTTIEVIPTDPALQADPVSEIKQVQEAADKAKARGEQAAVDMFQL
jgi:hypothetical protein